MKKPMYAWFIGAAPVAHLYWANIGLVNAHEAAYTMIASLALTTAVYCTLLLVTRNQYKASAITAASMFAFLYFGHLAAFCGSSRWAFAGLAVAAASVAAAVWKSRPGGFVQGMTPALNAATFCLLLFPSAHIALQAAEQDPARTWHAHRKAPGVPVAKEKNGPGRPDIYYIITDGYPSNAFLLRELGHDNSPFTRALEELGFFVAYDSRSNYGATLPSLASSLNLNYVSENASKPKVDDPLYLRMMIADSFVASFLQERGYTYVYMNSGYLLLSESADVLIDVTRRGTVYPRRETSSFDRFEYFREGSFYALAWETTPLRILRDWIRPSLLESDRTPLGWPDRRRVFASLEQLRRIAEMPEATFSFVHLIVPHGPVRFGRNGEAVEEGAEGPSRQEFLNQLQFINDRLLETLKIILARSSQAPIIVVQGDHGSDLGRVWTRDHRAVHFEILNAFHLPGAGRERVTRNISPINSFRVLLNAYFGTQFEELPVRHFDLPKGYGAPFEQVEVTGSLGAISGIRESRAAESGATSR